MVKTVRNISTGAVAPRGVCVCVAVRGGGGGGVIYLIVRMLTYFILPFDF